MKTATYVEHLADQRNAYKGLCKYIYSEDNAELPHLRRYYLHEGGDGARDGIGW